MGRQRERGVGQNDIGALSLSVTGTPFFGLGERHPRAILIKNILCFRAVVQVSVDRYVTPDILLGHENLSNGFLQ